MRTRDPDAVRREKASTRVLSRSVMWSTLMAEFTEDELDDLKAAVEEVEADSRDSPDDEEE